MRSKRCVLRSADRHRIANLSLNKLRLKHASRPAVSRGSVLIIVFLSWIITLAFTAGQTTGPPP